jgi:predicted 3-demethylubiquinone-9 3-methyltransferase (glyoxalase superfamily)
MQKISPFLWFDSNAEEAVNQYISIFKNSKIISTARYGKEGAAVSGKPEGSVMTIGFTLDGQEFTALNGGPVFSFTPAVSFIVNCDSQEELDRLWEKLSAGGEPGQCGWLKDRFGLSWQIIPTVLPELIGGKDAEKSRRAMTAMLQMSKIDIARLKQAAEQG